MLSERLSPAALKGPLAALTLVAALAATPGSALAGAGTLTFVISRDVENLDPHSTGAWQSNMVRELIYDNLVEWDAVGNPIPGLAKSWEASSDAKTYTFHLREGVKFHDGTPLDAKAVVASFERLLAPGRATAASGQMSFIESVKAIDPLTVQLKTKIVYPLTLQYLGTGLAAIVSPADIAAVGAGVIEKPIGTGPYVFKEWRRGDRLTVAKNPNYWGGEVGFDEVVMKAAPEASVRLTALTTGDVQLAELIAPTDYKTVQSNPKLKLIAGGGARFVYFNLSPKKSPTTDVRVRQAMNYAVDKEGIIKAILEGEGKVPDSPIGAQNFGYHASMSYKYDPAKAKALLAEAGYDTKQTLQAIYPTGRYYYAKEIAETVQAMLQAVGVKIEFNSYPDMTQYNSLEKEMDKVNMAYTSFYPSVMDADSALYIRYRTGQFLNFNYSNPSVDRLLDDGQNTLDTAERAKIYAKAQDTIMQDAPFLALYYQTVNSAATANLQGVKYYPNERLSVKWADFSK